MIWGLLACASFSVLAISSSSSGVMGFPSCQLLSQLFGRYLTRHLIIVDHGRSKATRAETSRGQNRDFSIGCRLTWPDTQVAFHSVHQLRRALDVARRPQTDDAGVFSRRLESKKMIERCHAISAAERDPQGDSDVTQGGLVQIPKGLLNGVQGFDQTT